MFLQNSSEEKAQTNEKKIKELGIQLDKLSADVEELYKTHELDANQIEDYYKEEANFTAEEWEILEFIREHHAKKMEAIRNKAVDPRETKKKYSERVVDPRWLFVR